MLYWKQFQEEQQRKKIFRDRRKNIKNLNFGIVSNNCWGGEIYKYYDLPFSSPFIGLFMYPGCYLKLLENWTNIDLQNIKIGHFSEQTQSTFVYPVGVLEYGIEIHFLHYNSLEEAESKWKRRAKRLKETVPFDRIFVRFCDRDEAAEDHFHRFYNLPFRHKISYSARPLPFKNNHTTITEEANPIQADDGVKVFWHELEAGFDLAGWLNE